MDIKYKIEQLFTLAENTMPLFLEAQETMLVSKSELETCERDLNDTELAVLQVVGGKNADERKALVREHFDVINAIRRRDAAQRTFDIAYAAYARHKANLAYVAKLTALLRLYEDIQDA